ncbi:MAG: hypothetical protein LBB46_01215 [Coriobacteriaceae bacterium]|jgi:hypothetical protein|nr:hypothetical protein [Coriobacteriaceae bacterium]
MYKLRAHFVAAALLALFIASALGTTMAVVKFVGESVHIIDTLGIKGRIVEEYDRAYNAYPGATVDKVVNVMNTGESDIVVRVKVEKLWGEAVQDANLNTSKGSPATDAAAGLSAPYPTDNITISYNDTWWLYDETDGYFYYKGVLRPGETTVEPLFESFTIDAGLGNEFQGLDAFITVKMECVQAGGNGISMWGKTLEYLGVPSYVSTLALPQTAHSTFVGGVGGGPDFVFNPDNTDLFANFKSLLPGETRAQLIEVKNAFDKTVEIFLRAEDIVQGLDSNGVPGTMTPGSPGYDEETLARINRLLREFATVVVTDEAGRVIYDGPIWGEPYRDASYPDAMRHDISLGFFGPDEMRKLNIQLQLDPSMGNEYQNLLGLIKWIWTAELMEDPPAPPEPPEPPEPPTPPVTPEPPDPPEPPVTPEPPTPPATPAAPKTGDTTNLVLWASLMLLSGLALCWVVMRSHKKR